MRLGTFSFFNAFTRAGVSLPSSMADEEATFTKSIFLYSLASFKYALVFIRGLSFIIKI